MRRARLGGDRGTGLVATATGAVAFVAFLLLAAHLLVGLYATSALAAAAHEAATAVARAPLDRAGPATAEAEAAARRRLGRWGEAARLDWSGSDDDDVVLRVGAPLPALLPPALASPVGGDQVEREVRVRRERWR